MAKRGEKQHWKALYAGGPLDGAGHRSSYEDAYTAAVRAREAAMSRMERAPQSHITVEHELTGDIAFVWYGPESPVLPRHRLTVSPGYEDLPSVELEDEE